jgi:deoxyribodipyrimidine photo-lyase
MIGRGPVLYWMSRERVAGNWALLRAQAIGPGTKIALAVVFTLTPKFLGAPLRAYDFMLKGLAQVEARLAAAGNPISSSLRRPGRNTRRFCVQAEKRGRRGHGFRSRFD